MTTIDTTPSILTRMHFTYQLYRRGTRLLVGAISTWHESSDDMITRTNDLFSQGFDVIVKHGGLVTCNTTVKW